MTHFNLHQALQQCMALASKDLRRQLEGQLVMAM